MQINKKFAKIVTFYACIHFIILHCTASSKKQVLSINETQVQGKVVKSSFLN